jgi:peptidoglycan/LPS O-acetylase OafA/YrhL
MMVAGIAIAELTRIVLVAGGHGLLGYFVLPARIDGACLGVITAILMRSEVKVAAVRSSAMLIWIAALLLLGVAAGLCMNGHSIESAAVNIYTQLAVSVASAAMIAVLVAKPDGWPNRALRAAPLVWFGTISYGVYLIQTPLVGVAHALIGENGTIILSWRSAGATIMGLIATVATAALSWRWLETPLNRWAHRVTSGHRDLDVRTPPTPFAAPPA